MTLQACMFSRFGAANVATSGRLLVTGHIANMFALLANADWVTDDFKAVTDSRFCDQMRSDIRAVKDCKATASGHVKFAVANAKTSADFFAGVISRRDTYATEADMVRAAFIQADAAGATTGASLSRLLKGKTPHEVKEEKIVPTHAERLATESDDLAKSQVAAPISTAALFETGVTLATVQEVAPTLVLPESFGLTLVSRFERYIDESTDSDSLQALIARLSARVLALHEAETAQEAADLAEDMPEAVNA